MDAIDQEPGETPSSPSPDLPDGFSKYKHAGEEWTVMLNRGCGLLDIMSLCQNARDFFERNQEIPIENLIESGILHQVNVEKNHVQTQTCTDGHRRNDSNWFAEIPYVKIGSRACKECPFCHTYFQ